MKSTCLRVWKKKQQQQLVYTTSIHLKSKLLKIEKADLIHAVCDFINNNLHNRILIAKTKVYLVAKKLSSKQTKTAKKKKQVFDPDGNILDNIYNYI